MTQRDRPVQPAQPPVVRAASVARPVDEAFAIFTDEIGAWWPLPTHGIFGDRSGSVRFVDGQVVETAIDGSQATWAHVLEWDPPHRFVMAWRPGRTEGPAGTVEVTFAAEAHGTRVQITHGGWEAFGDQARESRRSYLGPSAWGHVLDHFADGTEGNASTDKAAALVAAYAEFFAAAERGGFDDPAENEWTAEQVVAHVALNDLAMVAVAHGLVHGNAPAFENTTCQNRENLQRVIDFCHDMPGLLAFGRTCAAQAVATVHRLGTDQRATAVHCRMEHDGTVVLDEDRPWEQIAIDIQAGMHLPAHVAQLNDLRP